MVDTRYLKTHVEPAIREILEARYGVRFQKQFLTLAGGGTHEFDAVSEDGQFVVAIKTASGRTAGGKVPAGKIKDCIAELYFLSQIDVPRRILVLTSSEMLDVFQRAMRGKVAAGIDVEHVPLPPDVQAEVERVQRAASAEMFPVLDPGEQRVVGE